MNMKSQHVCWTYGGPLDGARVVGRRVGHPAILGNGWPRLMPGAAVTRRYAREIEAHGYARNAMEAVSVVRDIIVGNLTFKF